MEEMHGFVLEGYLLSDRRRRRSEPVRARLFAGCIVFGEEDCGVDSRSMIHIHSHCHVVLAYRAAGPTR